MDQASIILVWLAYLLFAAAFAVFLSAFFTQRPWMNRLGLVVAADGRGHQHARQRYEVVLGDLVDRAPARHQQHVPG